MSFDIDDSSSSEDKSIKIESINKNEIEVTKIYEYKSGKVVIQAPVNNENAGKKQLYFQDKYKSCNISLADLKEIRAINKSYLLTISNKFNPFTELVEDTEYVSI